MKLLTKELRALRGPALVLGGYGVLLAWRLCAELRLDTIPRLDTWADLGRLPLTAFATALGVWVLWSEDRRGTWSLLLTLPVGRARLLLTKLLAALLVLWPLTALPLLWTRRFIGVPGHVCGPVGPELLADAWHDWRLLPLGVLVGALVGLPQRATGVARWLPLLGAAVLAHGMGAGDVTAAAAVLLLALLGACRGDWAQGTTMGGRMRLAGWLRLVLAAVAWWVLLVGAVRLAWPQAPLLGRVRYQQVYVGAAGQWQLRPAVWRDPWIWVGTAWRGPDGRRADLPALAEARPVTAALPAAAAGRWHAAYVAERHGGRAAGEDGERWWVVPDSDGRRGHLEAWRWSRAGHRPVRWYARPGFLNRPPTPEECFDVAGNPWVRNMNDGGSDTLLCVDGGVRWLDLSLGEWRWMLPPQGINAAVDTAVPIGVLRQTGLGWLPESRTEHDLERVVVARTGEDVLVHLPMTHQSIRRRLPAALRGRPGTFTLTADGGLAVTDTDADAEIRADGLERGHAYRVDPSGRVVDTLGFRWQPVPGPESPSLARRMILRAADWSAPALLRRSASAPADSQSPVRWALLALLAGSTAALACWSHGPRGSRGAGTSPIGRQAWRRRPGTGALWALASKEASSLITPMAVGLLVLCGQSERLGVWAVAQTWYSDGRVFTDRLLGLAPGLAWTGCLVAAGLAWHQNQRERWDWLLGRTVRVWPVLLVKIGVGLGAVLAMHTLAAAYVTARLLRPGVADGPVTWGMVEPTWWAWRAPLGAFVFCFAFALWGLSRREYLRWRAVAVMALGAVAFCLGAGGQLNQPERNDLLTDRVMAQLTPSHIAVSLDGCVWQDQVIRGKEEPRRVQLGNLSLVPGGASRHDHEGGSLSWVSAPPPWSALPSQAARRSVVIIVNPWGSCRWYAVCRPPSLTRYHLVAYGVGATGPVAWISRRGYSRRPPSPEDDLDVADGGVVAHWNDQIALCDRGRLVQYDQSTGACSLLGLLPGLRAAAGDALNDEWCLVGSDRVRLPSGEVRPLGPFAGRAVWCATESRSGALLVADGYPTSVGVTLYSLDAAGRVIDSLRLSDSAAAPPPGKGGP